MENPMSLTLLIHILLLYASWTSGTAAATSTTHVPTTSTVEDGNTTMTMWANSTEYTTIVNDDNATTTMHETTTLETNMTTMMNETTTIQVDGITTTGMSETSGMTYPEMTTTVMKETTTMQNAEMTTTGMSETPTMRDTGMTTTVTRETTTMQNAEMTTTGMSETPTMRDTGMTTTVTRETTTMQNAEMTTTGMSETSTMRDTGMTTTVTRETTTLQNAEMTTTGMSETPTMRDTGMTTTDVSETTTMQDSEMTTTGMSDTPTMTYPEMTTTVQVDGMTTTSTITTAMSKTTASVAETTTVSDVGTTTTADAKTTATVMSETTASDAVTTTTSFMSETTTTPVADTTPVGSETTTTLVTDATTAFNPCNGITCQNGGTCVPQQSAPTLPECQCTFDYEGSSCEFKTANFGVWNAWSSCSQTCKGATKTRTRSCTDISNSDRTGDCVGDSSEEALCDITEECPLPTDPCKESADICLTDGVNHTCATKPDGTFKCLCEDGFVNDAAGVYCINKNECADRVNDCKDINSNTFKTGVSGCIDNIGDYSCTCRSGFTAASNSNNKVCNDVDECSGGNNCDDSERATCTNTLGSFSCACKAGYTGAGTTGTCNRDRLMSTSGHIKLSSSAAFSDYIFFEYALPFQNDLYPSVYVSKNGLILFTTVTEKMKADGVQKEFAHPGVLNSEFQEKAIVAPWWSYMNIVSNLADSGVYYKLYSSDVNGESSVIATLSAEVKTMYSLASFTGRQMLVATWQKLSFAANSTQLVTFQATIITDYINTYVKIIYQDRGMHYDIVANSVQNYPVVVGYQPPSGSRVDYPYSYLDMMNVNAATSKLKLEKIDTIIVDNESADVSIRGDSKGVMYYEISKNNLPSFIHDGLLCQTWINNDIADTVLPIQPNAEKYCPLEMKQITSSFSIFNSTVKYQCFSELAASVSNTADPRSLQCCYSNEGLLTTPLADGLNLYRRYAVSSNSQIEADNAYIQCCGSGKESLARADLCQAYLRRRPVCNGENFIASTAGGGMGDPHLSTLDQVPFTFNGHGEFILLKIAGSFELQGRFASLGSATYISSIVGKQTLPAVSDVVELRLDQARTSIEILKDGVIDNSQSLVLAYNNVVVSKKQSNEYIMTFSGGITTFVKLQNKLLLLTTEVPSAWAGQSTGLLGNFNGNKEDDFMFPNGTVLSQGTSATEEQIFHYGMNWQNTEQTSLFTYANPETWNDYVNDSFTPEFFNPDLNVMFPDNSTRNTVLQLCYGSMSMDPNPEERRECYFDFKVTGDSTLAAATSNAKTDLAELQTNLANYPPEVKNGNVTLEVIVDQSYPALVTLIVEDKNGDNISFLLDSEAPTGYSINNDTKTLSWFNVSNIVETDPSQTSLTITASDGSATSIFNPYVRICDCKNGGTCDFSVSSIEQYVVVSCRCPLGYVGQFCERDEDGCADNPCFQGVTCTDVAATLVAPASLPFTCGECPLGLTGNGQVCTDLNECAVTNPPACDQECTNLAGGFQCSCREGYSLARDTKTCLDKDECTLGTHSCHASSTTCVNTVGSYTCNCKSGYQASSDPMQCQDVNECNAASSPCPANSRCQNNVGSFDCVCHYGYRKNTQTNTCENIDECALSPNCEQLCVDGIGTYTCQCSSGFTLQIDTISCVADDQCNSTQRAACDGGNARSVCAVGTGGAVICICPRGFSLNANDDCENIDECATNTDVCDRSSSDCVDSEGAYTCRCKPGFSSAGGFECQDKNECSDGSSSCVSPATCLNTYGSSTCSCPSGYTLNANQFTCDNIDECAQSTLNLCDKDFGTCTDNQGGYTCSCKAGYTGDGYLCSDLNECGQPNKGGCQQLCKNNIGNFTCSCNDGYRLNADKRSCDDVNECSSDVLNNCYDSSTYCTNSDGSHTCSCPQNFRLLGDGHSCESLFVCDEGHGCSHTCGKVSGVDTCSCPSGFELGANSLNCKNINECENNALHNCDAANNVMCQDQVGSFKCVCVNSSYELVSSTECRDVDECLNPANSCPANSKCVNENPGFRCECLTGYLSVGGVCQDDNECVQGTHVCNVTLATCINNDGGYTCQCKAGYTGDGITCTDENECVAGTHSCDRRIGVGTCTNNVGSFSCGCSSGYVLASNNLTCNDVDECSERTDGCNFTCTNNVGGFTCSCPIGYRLQSDQKSCLIEFECAAGHGCDFECAKINNVDTCTCRDGYELSASNNKLCIDKNECTIGNPCDANYGVCTNNPGSYSCSCTSGYILGPGNVCVDRNGNWGDWQSWSTCSVSCGTGTQTRTKLCNNPSKEGSGADCAGSGSESQSCNTNVCPANAVESTYGVIIHYTGITIAQFTAVQGTFTQTVAIKLNEYCNANTSAVRICCGNPSSSYSPNPNNALVYTSSDKISIGDSYPVIEGSNLLIMIVVKSDRSNALCSAASASRRRRRAITLSSLEIAIPQTVLQDIMNDASVQSDITTALEDAILAATGENVNITLSQTSLVTTTASVTTVAEKDGTAGWVIAVAVIGAILGVLIIVLVILLVIKIKQNKVHPEDTENIQNHQ